MKAGHPNYRIALFAAVLLASCARTPAEKESRFMKHGKELVAKHDYQRAILEFRNAIQVMPKDAEPVYQLAVVYTDMHDYRMAFALLQKAVDLNPRHAAAQLMIARFQIGAQDTEVLKSARGRVERVLNADPNNTDGLRTLAVLDSRLGDRRAAEKDLQTAVATAPQEFAADVDLANVKLRAGDVSGAEAVLRNMVQRSPQSADAALMLAMFYLKHGETAEAEPLVQHALQLDPNSPTGLEITAEFQQERGQKEQADKTYARLAQLAQPQYRAVHAAFLLRQARRDEALTELDQLVKKYPGDRELRGMLVSTYLQSGRSRDAQGILDQALERNPKDVDALLQRSMFFLNAGQLNETEADLRSVLAFNAQSADAHYGLAKVAAMRGNALIQRQELHDALKLNPQLLAARIDLSAMLRPKSPKEALQVLDEAPGGQKTLPAYVTERIWALMANGENEQARVDVNKALSNGETFDLLYQDALLSAASKDFAQARSSLIRALKEQPQNMNAVDLLARTYSDGGNPAMAIATVEKYAADNPSSPYLVSLLGIWQANARKFSEARKTFTSVVTRNPSYLPGRLALADVDASLADFDGAERILKDVLRTQPNNTQARIRLAFIESKVGQKAAAVEDFRKVVSTEPKNERALTGLAYALAPTDPEGALKYAQNAVELAPDDPAAQDTLGLVYYHKKLYDLAISYFKSAVAKEVTAERKYHLALAYSKTGNQQLAAENLQRALQLDPKLQMPESLSK